jgi:4-alpha-glucanotransferase
VLLHPTSLPGPHGVGDLGGEAESFLDWAAAAGQTVWQILPLGPTSWGHSPYGSLSAFAGNPLLVSPDRLLEEGLLPRPALGRVPELPADHVDFAAAGAWKDQVLRASHAHLAEHAPQRIREAYAAFVESPDQAEWLDDWALFAALKARFDGRAWTEWDPELRRRDAAALARARRELAAEIDFHRYAQFVFHRQWERLRGEARRRGIEILGDLPIYVAGDSAEVWARPDLFALDDLGRPTVVAGVPPDYFSATGQRWGNPLYRWDRMRAEGYAWWIARLRANLRRADRVRLDHFRGFVAYWEVPASEPTAVGGRWVAGPGVELFAALRAALGELPLVAEDLGVITPDVEALRDALELPGMKVLQFAFGELDGVHAPHRHRRRSVIYTGTHDNDTTRGWHARLGAEERARVHAYLGTTGDGPHWDLVRAAYTSVAELAIVPLQDLLGLGSEARMNTPAEAAGNWSWRLRPGALGAELAERLRRLAALTGRLPREEAGGAGEGPAQG